jgi:hypothetical protein
MSSTSNQTKQTARKAESIRRLRAQNVKWEEIARRLKILKTDGSPDPGLAYKIGVEGYEPKGEEIRNRLGLKHICMTCLRAIRKSSAARRGAGSPWLSWWKKLRPADREERIRRQYEKERR